MANLIKNNLVYQPFEYDAEDDLEKRVIEYSSEIFGSNSFYIDVKKRIGKENILSIPDGYLIDFSFPNNPKIYIIEVELVTHDPYKHIGQQVLKFAVSYKASGENITNFLLKSIRLNKDINNIINKNLKKTDYRNLDHMLHDLVFNQEIGVIVITDEITDDLSNVLNQLSIKTDILEFKTYINKNDNKDIIHEFIPFQQEIRDILKIKTPIDIEALDTIVVPANEDGFKEVFLGSNCWYAIRISSSMIDRLKFIAGYQTSPIRAITYWAEIRKIEKYKNTDKYIIYFKDKAKKLKSPVKLVPKSSIKAPQSPRYTFFEKFKKAKNLNEVF